MKTLFCMQPRAVQDPCCFQGESPTRQEDLEDVRRACIKRVREAHHPEAEWMAKQGFQWTESEEETIPAAEFDEERDE